MRTSVKIIVGVTSVVTTLVAVSMVMYLIKRNNEERRLDRIAEEGYETAHDILFPSRRDRIRRNRAGDIYRENFF